MSAPGCHMGRPISTRDGTSTVIAWAHWNRRPIVDVTAGSDVRTTISLTPEQARLLAQELQVAAEVADLETERLAEARTERGHLMAEAGL